MSERSEATGDALLSRPLLEERDGQARSSSRTGAARVIECALESLDALVDQARRLGVLNGGLMRQARDAVQTHETQAEDLDVPRGDRPKNALIDQSRADAGVDGPGIRLR